MFSLYSIKKYTYIFLPEIYWFLKHVPMEVEKTAYYVRFTVFMIRKPYSNLILI